MRIVTFAKIPPNRFSQDGEGLSIAVDASHSFALAAFDAPVRVRGLRAAWRSEGDFRVTDPAREKTKAGDDARLRLGLLIAGPAPAIPFFAPAWVKAVRDHMRLPSDKMLYVIAGSPSPVGSRWPNPYAKDITCVAAGSTPGPDGWSTLRWEADAPMGVVGVWIAADGDDSGSRFVTHLKDFVLEKETP